MVTTLTDSSCRLCGGSTGLTVADHEAKLDPHSQYLTQTEADALYAGTGDGGAAAVATHAGEADPHPDYALEADVTTDIASAVTAHEAAGDPHPGYALESFAEDLTGFSTHTDATLTSGAPLTLVAATATNLTNDDAATVDTQLPNDAIAFYNGTTIVGDSVGDLLDIQVQLTVDPTITGAWLDLWINDGVTDGLHRQTVSLIKGAVAQEILVRFLGVVTADWVANGGQVRVESNDTPDLYDVSYVIARAHGVRTT